MGVAGAITDIAETGELTFVTERFEVAGVRLEVAGHWHGVRGRRFVRPVLWLHAGGGRRRLVAVLDHKPWDAADGAPWTAAFPWDGGRLEGERAELEVGREALVELPMPGAARPRKPSETARLRRELATAQEKATALRAALDGARTETERARAEGERARADGERLVNDEYKQRERALRAAEEASRRAREAEEARALLERQLNTARVSHASLEDRLATAEVERDRLRGSLTAAGDSQAGLEERLAAVEAERDRLHRAARAARSEMERLRDALKAAEVTDRGIGDRLATAEADRERLRHALSATEAERARLERDVASARADRERVEAELAAVRAPARAVPAVEPAGPGRLGTPRSGSGLWLVRLVALALVVALFAAVAVILMGVL